MTHFKDLTEVEKMIDALEWAKGAYQMIHRSYHNDDATFRDPITIAKMMRAIEADNWCTQIIERLSATSESP